MAAANAIKAIRASGAIVQIEPSSFLAILDKLESPLVVTSQSKDLFFRKYQYQYMTNYKGFVLITESNKILQLPEKTELIKAERIWLPRV